MTSACDLEDRDKTAQTEKQVEAGGREITPKGR